MYIIFNSYNVNSVTKIEIDIVWGYTLNILHKKTFFAENKTKSFGHRQPGY